MITASKPVSVLYGQQTHSLRNIWRTDTLRLNTTHLQRDNTDQWPKTKANVGKNKWKTNEKQTKQRHTEQQKTIYNRNTMGINKTIHRLRVKDKNYQKQKLNKYDYASKSLHFFLFEPRWRSLICDKVLNNNYTNTIMMAFQFIRMIIS